MKRPLVSEVRNRSARRVARAMAWLLVIGPSSGVLGCNSEAPSTPVEPTPPPAVAPPVIVSSSHVGFDPTISGATPTGIVYVAAPPGSIPYGYSVTIRGGPRNVAVSVYLADDGFDPVAFPAGPGDTLQIDVETYVSDSSSFASYRILVPATSRPVLLRTWPSAHARDVPLNTRPIVVFSEPVSIANSSDPAVQLIRSGIAVPGRVAFADTQHVSVAFAPEGLLVPSAGYTLAIGQDIRNRDGLTLAAGSAVDFTAGTSILDRPPGGAN